MSVGLTCVAVVCGECCNVTDLSVCPSGLPGPDLHRPHRQSEFPAGESGGRALHVLGAPGWGVPGEATLK